MRGRGAAHDAGARTREIEDITGGVSDDLVERASAAYVAAWARAWWARQYLDRSTRFEDWPEDVKRDHRRCIRAALEAALTEGRTGAAKAAD
jgi:hypothetical protein